MLVDTYDEFSHAVNENWKNMTAKYGEGIADYTPYTTLSGGLWLGDDTSKPTVLVNIGAPYKVTELMNFYTVMSSGIGISSSFFPFASTKIPNLTDMKALIFVIYYGLIMAW